MTQDELNKQLTEMQASFERRIPQFQRQVRQAFDLARISVLDIIAKYSKDGKLLKTRANAINKELDAVEAKLYRDLLSLTTKMIEDAAQNAGEGVNKLLVAAVGIGLLMALQDEQEASETFSAAGVLIAIGAGLLLFMKSVVDTVFSRKGDDGLNLRDRLRKLAQDIASDLRKTLRKSIATGEDYTVTQRNILKTFTDVGWRIDRITETEATVAYRTAIAKASETSKFVEALKIVDFPHGKPSEHERHKCYEYAHSNEYGLGDGVYPVTTRKIRNPHPQCRARLELVLKEDAANAR